MALSLPYTPEQARQLAPLQLAFVGDAVQSLMVRTHLTDQNLKVRDMHTRATREVNAVSQARAMERMLPLLTPEEGDIVRRGRNAHPRHAGPKSATAGEYAGATGLEALLGYLYLTGQTDRLCFLAERLQAEENENA